MRAGLLSDKQVISLLNENFVCTWALVDEVKKYQGPSQELANTLAKHWEYPMDLMFLSSAGKFVSKLNSFAQLHGVHPDVGHDGNVYDKFASHEQVFLKHAREFLNARGEPSPTQ